MVAVTTRSCGSTFLNSPTGVPSMPVSEIRYTRAAAKAPHAAATGPSTHFTRSLADTFVDRHFANAVAVAQRGCHPLGEHRRGVADLQGRRVLLPHLRGRRPHHQAVAADESEPSARGERGTVPSTELKHSNVNAIR